MGQALRQLFKEGGFSTKRVVGSVAGQNTVVIRVIEVPKMTDAELKETMKWEVERHVPFAPSETIMDYQALPPSPDPDNPNMEVLLAVAQQDVVSNFIDSLFASGLDPIAIDIEPLAAGRALLEVQNGQPIVHAPAPLPPVSANGEFIGDFGNDAPQTETVAVVNIGASNTDISIFQDGQLVFPRSLPLAGDSLTRAIAETLNYSMEQAERYKRDYGEVQLDRMAVYTGTAYGEGTGYDGPSFEDTGTDFLSGENEEFSAPPNPFGTTPAEPEALDQNPFLTTPEGPQFDDVDRTQPIPRRILNIAKPVPREGSDNPFTSPSEPGFGLPGDTMGINEQAARDQVFESIAPVLGELATELRRSLDYYRSRAQGRSVDRLLLAGGSASLTNFAAFLQNELQVPVSVADPLAGLEIAAKRYDAVYIRSLSPAFAVAVGLAARNAVFGANPLPKALKAVKPPKGKKDAASQAA